MESSYTDDCYLDASVHKKVSFKNLYPWPQADAAFLLVRNMNKDICYKLFACRQTYLRSYRFCREEKEERNPAEKVLRVSFKNLYPWPQADAAFLLLRSMDKEICYEVFADRQEYLRSYPFCKEEKEERNPAGKKKESNLEIIIKLLKNMKICIFPPKAITVVTARSGFSTQVFPVYLCESKVDVFMGPNKKPTIN